MEYELIQENIFTSEQEQMLIGSLLGDGCIYKHPNGKNPYFYVARKSTDSEYLMFQFQYFQQFSNYNEIKFYDIYDKRTNKTYHQCKFVTRSSEIFQNYYKEWYKPNKIIPDNLQLTPLICAIWFCDDGCVTRDKKCNRLKIKLATHGFSYLCNQKLCENLKTKFGEHFGIAHDNGNNYIFSADGGTKKFIQYIENHIPYSMSRKIKWTLEDFLQKKSPTHLKNRGRLDFSDQEKTILKILLTGDNLSAKTVAIKLGKINAAGQTPSNICRYLYRFVDKGMTVKSGILKSYKNPIAYTLTDEGRNICQELGI